MGDATFIAEVVLDTRQLEVELGNLKVKFGETASNIASAWGIATAAFEQVAAAARPLIQFTEESIAAATEAEAVNNRLVGALKQRGQYTDQAVQELSLFNAALQRQTNIQDEQLATVQATLVAMGVYRQDLRETTLAVVGLSERTGHGLEESTLAVGKAVLGNTNALRKLGVEGRNANETIASLADQAKIAAEGHDTYAFQVERLSVAYGELEEEFGRTITQNHNMKTSTGDLATVTQAATKVLGLYNESQKDFSKYGESSTRTYARMIPILGGFSDAIFQIKDAIVGVAKEINATDDAVDALGSKNGGLETPKGQSATDAAWAAYKREEAADDREETRREAAAKRKADQIRRLEDRQLADQMDFDKKYEAFQQQQFHRETEQDNTNLRHQRELDKDRIHAQTEAANESNKRLAAAYDRKRFLDEQAADTETNIEARKVEWQNSVRENTDRFYAETTDAAAQGLGGLVAAAANAAANGENVLDAMGGFFGGMIQQMGTQLIQMGVAAEVMTLLSFIPAFEGVVGPPGMSALAGAAAIAAGLAMVGVGAAMGGSRGGGGGGGRSGGGGGPARHSTESHGRDPNQLAIDKDSSRIAQDRARERRAREGGGTTTEEGKTVINNYFDGKPLMTDRQLGQHIDRLRDKGAELRGERGGRGRGGLR